MDKQGAYQIYKYSEDEVAGNLARYVYLDNPESYPFDHFHAHEYNELMVFLKGGGTHNISFHNYPIAHGSIHLIAARDLHWVERSMQSEGFAIVYKEQFLYKLAAMNPEIDFQEIFSYSRIINLNQAEQRRFALLFRELQHSAADKRYMLQLIGAMLTKIATNFHHIPNSPKTDDPLLRQTIALIHKQFRQHPTLAEYARQLHVSPRTLQNRLKQASGKTLRQLEQDRLLKEAKQLLLTSAMPVSEVAWDLGFKELAHFTNWFKSRTGQTPSAFKL